VAHKGSKRCGSDAARNMPEICQRYVVERVGLAGPVAQNAPKTASSECNTTRTPDLALILLSPCEIYVH